MPYKNKKSPEVKEKLRKKALKYKYGLSYDHFLTLVAQQNGLCALCGNQLTKPYVDHDHKTGMVRGILCNKCNAGLGCFDDNPHLMLKARDYLLHCKT